MIMRNVCDVEPFTIINVISAVTTPLFGVERSTTLAESSQNLPCRRTMKRSLTGKTSPLTSTIRPPHGPQSSLRNSLEIIYYRKSIRLQTAASAEKSISFTILVPFARINQAVSVQLLSNETHVERIVKTGLNGTLAPKMRNGS